MLIKNSKINRISAFSLLLLAAVLLQTTILSDVRIFGRNALFLIPITIAVGLFNGTTAGFVFGLILGFLVDSTVSDVFAYYSLLLLAVGLFSGFVAEYLMVRHLFAAIILYLSSYVFIIFFDLIIRLIVTSNFSTFFETALNQTLSAAAGIFYMPLCYYIVRGLHLIFAGDEDV